MPQKLSVKVPGPDGSRIPPTGWSCFLFDVPEASGIRRAFTGRNIGLLRQQVERALTKAGLDPSTAVERIHSHTANRLVSQKHADWVEGLVVRKRKLSEHWKGTKAYATVIALESQGRSILTLPAEAERRASICASGAPKGKPCPMNVLAAPGTAIEEAENKAIAAKVGDRVTEYDDLVGTCNACSCKISTIVHLMPEVLGLTENDMQSHPAFCWKHQLKKSS